MSEGSVYSAAKVFRHPDQVASWLAEMPSAPLHIRIKPINRCNHSCWYCAYRADGLQLGDEMDEEARLPVGTLRRIATDLVSMGVKAVTFSGGGEPLLYRELPEIIGILGGGGVKVATLTNGANLKGRMADAFAAHGAWVRVSVDAVTDDSYARARGVRPGAFTKLLENMADFTARKSSCVLGVNLVIGAENAGKVAEACAIFRSVGVAHVKLSGVVVANSGAENAAYHLAIQDTVAAQIVEARRLETDSFRIVDHYHALPERFTKLYQSCSMLRFLTVIGADGCVYTCQDKAYTDAGRIGELDEGRFRDFWFSERVQAFLSGFNPSVSCAHHCVSHTKNMLLDEVARLNPEHADFV
ncbi:radical SAM protein [Azospirillum sp. TSO5]|uniref:radical SAM protein n=1 Tax=Azospirillum sp. TSO5 TaxID=716760 RepID=UPI000D609074|nr:radical SAM protein [Azospirillum sp. TSO5]PWC97423.1 radical SAM protein [Azospirillum sp. TSO5]